MYCLVYNFMVSTVMADFIQFVSYKKPTSYAYGIFFYSANVIVLRSRVYRDVLYNKVHVGRLFF